MFQNSSSRRIQSTLLCVLAVAISAFAGCQSTLSRDTKRIQDEYDVELARLETKYQQDLAHCESTPNPKDCKAQLSEAYRERLELNWALEQAEFEKTVCSAVRAGSQTSSN